MKKVAFFVEGQTEVIFTKKLLHSLVSSKGLQIETEDASQYVSLNNIRNPQDDAEIYIVIFNCEGDNSVKQKIKKSYTALVESGYEHIIGLRDLYPLSRSDLSVVKEYLNIGLPSSVPVDIVISVMEIEAWFIQEYSHFTGIDDSLTPDKIHEKLNFNPRTDDASLIDHPSKFLNDIYQLVNREYSKKEYEVHLITDHIDYGNLYLETRYKKPDLHDFISSVEIAIS